YAKSAFDAKVGFGKWNTNYVSTKQIDIDGQDALYAKAGYNFGVAKLGADYVKFQNNDTKLAGNELYGIDLYVPVGDFRVQGEYVKNTTTTEKYDDAWNVGLGYGKADWKKPGTWALDVFYNEIGKGTYFGGTGLGTDILKNLNTGDQIKFWNVGADVTLQKNVQLHAEYAFGADLETAADPDDAWTVSLNYKF
ncbi:MAG: S-layer protein, partial [Dialister sp.]|nr:S-layer protein [Dialister sp.]